MSNQSKSINQSLVSICIPSYNHEKYIAATIDSVILQDYKNIELIIIDDFSTDNSDIVINSVIDKCKERFVRFEYIKNEKNKGISYNLNKAIKWSQGKHFYAIASDDILMPFKTSLLVSEIEKLDDSYAAIFGDALFINELGEKIYIDKNKTIYTTQPPNSYNTFLKFFGQYNYLKSINNYFEITYYDIISDLLFLPAASVLIKLSAINEVGGYTNGNRVEDFDMWFKLTQKYKMALIDTPVSLYRLHGQISFFGDTKDTSKKLIAMAKDSLATILSQKNFAVLFSKNETYKQLFYSRAKIAINHIAQFEPIFAKRSADFLSRWIFQKTGEKILFM